jgi:hypothetical protein
VRVHSTWECGATSRRGSAQSDLAMFDFEFLNFFELKCIKIQ